MHALRPIFFGVLAMAIVVAVSNVAVGYPINDWITWGALTYPVAFLVTDVMNRSFGASNARKVVYGGFLVGVVFSIWLATLGKTVGAPRETADLPPRMHLFNVGPRPP